MKPLLPSFCRWLGYIVIALGVLLPVVMFFNGNLTDVNLSFYKESCKILIMAGAIMILFALHKGESPETIILRNRATRNALLLTFVYLFGSFLYHFCTEGLMQVENSSFLIFLILNVIILEANLARFFYKGIK